MDSQIYSVVIFCILLALNVDALIKQRCKYEDEACILESTKATLKELIKGEPAKGIESSDPVMLEIIEGDIAGLKFKFIQSNVEGFGSCEVTHVKTDLNASNVELNLSCPHLHMYGNYTLNGELVKIPVYGNGLFNIICKNFKVGMKGALKMVIGPDGVQHLHIKNFKLNIDHNEGSMKFDFKNLFNGQKDLSDAVHNFANENWKLIAVDFELTIFEAYVKKILKGANKLLSFHSSESLFLN